MTTDTHTLRRIDELERQVAALVMVINAIIPENALEEVLSKVRDDSHCYLSDGDFDFMRYPR